MVGGEINSSYSACSLRVYFVLGTRGVENKGWIRNSFYPAKVCNTLRWKGKREGGPMCKFPIKNSTEWHNLYMKRHDQTAQIGRENSKGLRLRAGQHICCVWSALSTGPNPRPLSLGFFEGKRQNPTWTTVGKKEKLLEEYWVVSDQGSVYFSVEDDDYFQLGAPCCLYCNDSSLLLSHENGHRQFVNRQVCVATCQGNFIYSIGCSQIWSMGPYWQNTILGNARKLEYQITKKKKRRWRVGRNAARLGNS